MSEERHVSCIEAPDSPCTPETCEETICWVCEEPDPSWPCPSRRAQDAEAAIARVRDVCDRIWDDARYAHKYGFLEVVREVRYALEGDSDD